MRVTLPWMSFRVGHRRSYERVVGCWLAFVVLWLYAAPIEPVQAQTSSTTLDLSFTPTHRAQLAVWIERDDGLFMGTFALTHSVAVAGIGNRPGALQMNSGYRWPYGRREGVLPVWAHRRAQAPGAQQFRRVIFQDRDSEGFASRTSSDNSVDDFYCLSFNLASTDADALDAVTCASVFSSDKGRFITEADRARSYGEPFEAEDGVGSMRALSLDSLYPPRRDVARCTAPGCFDHEDVASYVQHARSVMPELDAISRATPQGERPLDWSFSLPDDWSAEHDYVLYVEANVEGDHNESFSEARFRTPKTPNNAWDSWALKYGYPYRGQPSVVYALPFSLRESGTVTASEPAGYGALQGEDGEVRPLDATISDDPLQEPGSGADRLRSVAGVRATLRVNATDPCSRADAPAACGQACGTNPAVCGELSCDPSTNTCKSYCAATRAPDPVKELKVSPYPDDLRAHMWARLSFRAASSERPIGKYEVRVKPEGGEWSDAFTHDSDEELLAVALDVCNDPENATLNRCRDMQAGTMIEVDLAGLKQSTSYSVAVTPRDARCGERGATMMVDFATAARVFTTVSPCFVATATYGSPLATQVSVLRRVRDRYLAPHAAGRALIDLYYSFGPHLAELVREHAWLREASLLVLTPIVSLSSWWID